MKNNFCDYYAVLDVMKKCPVYLNKIQRIGFKYYSQQFGVLN